MDAAFDSASSNNSSTIEILTASRQINPVTPRSTRSRADVLHPHVSSALTDRPLQCHEPLEVTSAPNASPPPFPFSSSGPWCAKKPPDLTVPILTAGVLVECDASIKSIIVNIDNEYNNEFVIEVLDDQHIVVKETMVQALKQKLDDRLRNTTQREEEVESD